MKSIGVPDLNEIVETKGRTSESSKSSSSLGVIEQEGVEIWIY